MIQLSFFLVLIIAPESAFADYVKKSSSGICHESNSQYYERTQNYTRFESINECLEQNGRLPAGHAHSDSATSDISEYNRSAFRHWIDENRNCLNTRHELLKSQSTGPVVKTEEGCRILHGRWNDPYTGEIFLESRFVDVDHLVPLRWAWSHGADKWDEEKRERFANDERNLFIVSASANRSKGAKGPDEWLPPNQAFRCQYVTRYLRVLILYDFPHETRADVTAIRADTCS
ncbi:MAG: HNH endonuclease [Idiomarina sp.]|nr:HNH endonuclease [Idiomarina sp.]